MAYEIPKDLIEKVQALLRKESGLPSYDPHDPSLPPLPSLDASISELDKSMPPEFPRCKKCSAKFLRGSHSLICIYCGSKKQEDDNLPGPISFNSSSGSHWLLHSLDLNKSESIGSSSKKFELNKGQRSLKLEVALHELLDFNIALSDKDDKPKTIVTNKALQPSRSLNLTGAYLGNVFSKAPSITVYDVCAPIEPVTEQIQSSPYKTFVGEGKLASSSSISSGDSVVRTTSENNDLKVSPQDENFNESDGTKDNSSPSDIALQHSDVSTSAPRDSTIDRHDDSLDN